MAVFAVFGALVLCLVVVSGAAAAAPPNDDFADAQVLSGALPLTVSATNVGATRELGEPTSKWPTPAGHSVWYRWEATSTGYVDLDTCNSEIEATVGVYTGTEVGALALVVASRNYHGPHCSWRSGEVLFRATAGTVYSILVDGVEGAPMEGTEGTVALDLEQAQAPANDDFVDAKTIFYNEGLHFPFTNWGATKELGEPDHGSDQGGASIWFDWTAPRSRGVVFQACDQPIGEEAEVAVYTGPTVAALTPVPQIAPIPSENCRYAFFAIAGVTYHIAFDGRFDPASGAAEMFNSQGGLNYFPANDDFGEATELFSLLTGQPYTNVTVIGPTTVGATKEPGEPAHAGNPGGASVWFKWTAPVDGSVQITACEANFRTLVAAYTGSSVDALTPVASAPGTPGEECRFDDSGTGQINFDVDEGVTYDIAVDGVDGAWGYFDFSLRSSNERLETAAMPGPSLLPKLAAPVGRSKTPKTKIDHRAIEKGQRNASFTLGSDEAGSTFRCKLDRRRWTACATDVVYQRLAYGRHTFRAAAVSADGLADSSPAGQTFKIARPAPRKHRTTGA
jgi:hypothetical protein